MTMPARAAAVRAASSALAALALAGCASLWHPPEPPAQAPAQGGAAPASAAASTASAVSAASAASAESVASAASAAASDAGQAYQLEVEAPAPLRKLLLDYLDLARFQEAPAGAAPGDVELERLARAAPAQARALLETEGYFDADVRVARETAEDGRPRLRVTVEPGPRTTVGAVALDAHFDAADAEAGERELAALRAQWPLGRGKPFRQAAWNDAKNATLARLRADGFAAAQWQETAATVDAPSHTAALALVAQPGPRYRLGELRIRGLRRYDEAAVRNLAAFAPGTPYTEHTLLDFQERLQKSGLFEGASVEIDPDPATHGAAPVLVRVRELPLQQATFGVGYSANVGPRLSLEHYHRRLFRAGGTDWGAKNKIELGPSLKSWEGELTSHPLDGLYRNLVAGAASRLRTDDELLVSSSLRVGRTQDSPRFERLYFAELTHARLEGTALTTSAEALTANYHWVRRDLDSVLLPTRGDTLSLQGAVGYGRGRREPTGEPEEHGRGPLARAYVRYTWYRPIGRDWYATLRAEAGEVFARQPIGVPDTLLFRAGGDDSVRGYGYRTLGPLVNGVVTSGRTLVTGSAEIARPISPAYPSLWWAAFVDAGNAADRWSELHPALGYGVGLRWRSPVGPLRVDLAYGQDVRQFRVHMSVGIAF